jgi:heme-degrading monooxygenase HmoA
MIAVLFEVLPHPGHREAYLAIAARLKSELLQVEGFVDVERFESLSTPGKLLSLSWWRDEAAVARWRAVAAHQRAHVAGREVHFADYRIRVAQVVRDYGMRDREQAPADARARLG